MCVICFVLCRVMSCHFLTHVSSCVMLIQHNKFGYSTTKSYILKLTFSVGSILGSDPASVIYRPGISNLLCVRDGILTSVMT